MSKHNVVALSGREKIRDELTELRDGAHKLSMIIHVVVDQRHSLAVSPSRTAL